MKAVQAIAMAQSLARRLPVAKRAAMWKNRRHSREQPIDCQVIDSEGYRENVGIILSNSQGRLLWAKRIGQRSWQFPQGGIRRGESPEEAMYRELAEEVGLKPEHVEIIGSTRGWLRYRLPRRLVRRHSFPTCIGQKQVWFLLRMKGQESDVRLDCCERPEFDHWRWVDYWYPMQAVVSFKRGVYLRALRELAPLLFAGHLPEPPPPPRRRASGNGAEGCRPRTQRGQHRAGAG